MLPGASNASISRISSLAGRPNALRSISIALRSLLAVPSENAVFENTGSHDPRMLTLLLLPTVCTAVVSLNR